MRPLPEDYSTTEAYLDLTQDHLTSQPPNDAKSAFPCALRVKISQTVDPSSQGNPLPKVVHGLSDPHGLARSQHMLPP